MYFLQCISPNGWKSQVREFKVDTTFSGTLNATNNGPIEAGNTLSLSTGVVPTATSYAWTGPYGFTSSSRLAQRTNFADSLAGTYRLTITATGGCTFTDSTVVEASGCNIYVNSVQANGDTTYKLTRIAGQMSQFQPLTLTVLPYTGNNTFGGYYIQWMHNGSAISGATGRTISVNKPGEYRTVLTLKSNPQTICEAIANISGEPCKIYELDLSCQVPSNIILPNAVAAGIQLGVGDEFTAGDYTVVVKEIISGSPAGWKGKGYVKMKLVSGIVLKQISVNFENAVVNECYELASGSVITDYDPNWGNLLDMDDLGLIGNTSQILQEISDLLSVYTMKDKDKLSSYTSNLENLKTEYLNSPDLTNEEKLILIANISLLKNSINEFINCDNNNSNVRINATTCDVAEVQILAQSITPVVETKITDKRKLEFGNLQNDPISLSWGDRLTPVLFPNELGSNSDGTKRNNILVSYRRLPYNEIRKVYEHGGPLSMGTRTVLSSETETKLLNHFYGNSGKPLVFGTSEPISKGLDSNPTFRNYHLSLMNRMQNQVVLNLSSESKFTNQLTSRFLFDKIEGGIGLIDFSQADEIIDYDYYGLMGGTQVIEVEMTLIERITKIPNNVIYPIKAPITYSSNKKTELEINYTIGDWYGSDFLDIYDPNNFKKNSQPSLKAFFVLQHDFGHKPFKAQIKYKKKVIVIPNT